MNAQKLKGMPVVSMADGSKVGDVDDLLFDMTELRIAALSLHAGRDRSILPFAGIRSIGADAVMIESTAATEGAAGQTAREGLRGLGDLVGLPVVDGDGTRLGEVEDLGLGADGSLDTVEVRSGGVLGMGVLRTTVPAAAIRMIGPKLITVEFAPPPGGGDPGDTAGGKGAPLAGA